MRPKERETILQRWRAAIQRETRDMDSLDQIFSRAMNDPDVRTDSDLENMIRSEIQQRRSAFGPKEHEHHPSPVAKPFKFTTPPSSPSPPRFSAPTPSNPARVDFDRMAHTLSRCLEDSNEAEAMAVCDRMRALQAENPGVISAAAIDPYARQIEKLTTHLESVRGQIATLIAEVVAASRQGDDAIIASLMRRLSAVHLAYPRILDEQRLEEIRRDIVEAAEQQDERLQVKELVERERSLAAEIKRLAAAVQAFHRIARVAPVNSEALRIAEAEYVLTVREVGAHDPEWVAGVVLELADLLAECASPPPGTAGRIDRFLDSIRSSLRHIHGEMRQIVAERGATKDK